MILSDLRNIKLFCITLLIFFYKDIFSQTIQHKEIKIASFQKAINFIYKGQEFGLNKNFDSANYYINKGKYISEINNNNDLNAYANLYSSRIAYWQGEIKKARIILNKNQKTKYNDSIQILTNLLFGEINRYEKNNIEALKYFIKANKQLLNLPFLTKKDSGLILKSYFNVAIVHEDFQNLEKAKYYFTKGLNFVYNSNDRSYFLFRISNLYNKEKNVKQELKYLKEAIEIAERNKWQLMLPTYYSSISDYYIQIKKGDSAIYYADKGLHNNTYCRLNWLNANKGKGYYLNKEYNKATLFFNKALTYTTPEESLDVYKNLRELYTETKQYELALQSNNKYLKLKDSLDKLKVKQEIFEISEKYESKIKESTIKKQEKKLLLSFILVALSVVIIVFLAFYYRKQKKQKHVLYLRNLHLAQKLQKGIAEKFTKETLTIEEARKVEIEKKILDLINSKFYLSKDITLVKMSKLANTNTAYLSKVINEKYDKSFSNFINDLRISYTLKQLEILPNYRNLTIDDISGKAGFSSNSVFYIAFKKFTGLTPSYYIKKKIADI